MSLPRKVIFAKSTSKVAHLIMLGIFLNSCRDVFSCYQDEICTSFPYIKFDAIIFVSLVRSYFMRILIVFLLTLVGCSVLKNKEILTAPQIRKLASIENIIPVTTYGKFSNISASGLEALYEVMICSNSFKGVSQPYQLVIFGSTFYRIPAVLPDSMGCLKFSDKIVRTYSKQLRFYQVLEGSKIISSSHAILDSSKMSWDFMNTIDGDSNEIENFYNSEFDLSVSKLSLSAKLIDINQVEHTDSELDQRIQKTFSILFNIGETLIPDGELKLKYVLPVDRVFYSKENISQITTKTVLKKDDRIITEIKVECVVTRENKQLCPQSLIVSFDIEDENMNVKNLSSWVHYIDFSKDLDFEIRRMVKL